MQIACLFISLVLFVVGFSEDEPPPLPNVEEMAEYLAVMARSREHQMSMALSPNFGVAVMEDTDKDEDLPEGSGIDPNT